MIDYLFAFQSSRERQRSAPLFQEREAFLIHLHVQQVSFRRLRSIASMLLQIIRLLDLFEPRMLSPLDISQAARQWCCDAHFVRSRRPKSYDSFHALSTRWFKFAGWINGDARVKTAHELIHDDFCIYVAAIFAPSQCTIRHYSERSAVFLSWTFKQKLKVSNITLLDVERFLREKIAEGNRPRTIASICVVLRKLFRFAQQRGINNNAIASKIKAPTLRRYEFQPRGPAWRDVRRLLDHDFGTTAFSLRANAIVAVCAIYALRSCEVVALKLADIDWRNETISIRRAKSNRLQILPLQYEGGKAILNYLYVRPLCGCQQLFVTMRPPFRPIRGSCTWIVVSSRLKALGIKSANYGVHGLRHSCATHLLQNGSSLKDVADFLGHSSVSSAIIYAKYDAITLAQVAKFSLTGVL
jgi:integrase/recombinase XerD